MCRNIRVLFNLAPPAGRHDTEDAALQFVRKLCGFRSPSRANQAAFDEAFATIAHAADHLLSALVTNAPPRDRAILAARARARSAKRFGEGR